MKLLRTDSSNPDFKTLCARLDDELNLRYGRAQATYDQHNIIEDRQPVIVGYLDDLPVACGCYKVIDPDTVEIKRMFVTSAHRRKGLSTRILSALEAWAQESGYSAARLETGKGQPEAIGLYKKAGYEVTENFAPYIGMENSICMKKTLNP